MEKITYTILLASLVVIVSCTENEPAQEKTQNFEIQEVETNEVKATLSSYFTNMLSSQVYEMDVKAPKEITTENNMIINIPENALIYKNGDPVKGKVQIEIKEYYSPAEIMLSNIPMCYETGGNSYSFESDGMFTISAKQGGEDLLIAENKHVECITERKKKKEGFEFYSLENGTWEKDEQNEITDTKNGEIIPIVQKPKKPAIMNPIKFNPNYYTIEDVSIYMYEDGGNTNSYNGEVMQMNIDVNENPWILDKKQWKIDQKRSRIIHKLAKEEFDTIPYTIIYAVRGNKRYEEVVREKEEYEKAFALYKQNLEDRENAGQLTISEMTQTLLVDEFGTFNIDRFYIFPPNQIVEKKYVIPSTASYESFDKLFLVVKDKEGDIIPIDLQIYPDILRFSKKEKNSIIAMKGNKLYGWNIEEFTEELIPQMKQSKFELALNEIEVTNLNQFDEILQGLF